MRKNRPNVIILLTDDQGYGDLSCHGNPKLRTPAMDRLHEESVRLTNFHVAPVCTPTRSQLLTACDALRNGAYSWAYGHECIFPEIPTMADIFKNSGYRTGHFGKWHLGDNYPFRPHDRGFEESIHHKGAAITQSPDYWNNDYFDDHYWDKGDLKQYKGYCTDVWFNEAMKFISRCVDDSDPFFVYLPTNCPHAPLYVPDYYRTPYRHLGHQLASFFGMITNIDENMRRMDTFLELRGLKKHTILIFMTDNGGTAGVRFYNAGMRGAKGSLYEGGHRVPCFIRWPQSDFIHGRDFDRPTQVQDILPTLMTVCGLSAPNGFPCDGLDLSPILAGGEIEALDERKLVVQFTTHPPVPREGDACVIWQDWRLISGEELYNVKDDPAQENNVADMYHEIVADMSKHYDDWWHSVETSSRRINVFPVGGKKAQVVNLCNFDWDDYEGDIVDVSQRAIRRGDHMIGKWHIEIEEPGDYIFEMRRWPLEAEAAIVAGVPEYRTEDGDIFPEGFSLPIVHASLTVHGQNRQFDVGPNDKAARVTLGLKKGETTIQAVFCDENGETLCGVYYLSIRSASEDT